MTPIAQALSAALLHFVWQGLLVAFLLGIALFLMKNRSANARYLASCAALVALAILPVVTTLALYRSPMPAVGAGNFTTTFWPAFTTLPRAAAAQVSWLPVLQAWALPLWSAGVLIFSLRLAWGCRQVAHLRGAGEPAGQSILAAADALRTRLGLFHPISIVVTSQSDGPSVVGWLRPTVLLPAATLLGLSEQQLEGVLAHELAHIRRHDYLVNLLQNLVETLLFYHPAVWWTSARMRHERELCCDDIAVQACGDPVCYARALTTLEKMRGAEVSLAVGGTGGSLLYRIQRLMGLKPRDTASSRVPAIAAMLLGVACLALNMNWAHAQERSVPGILGSVATVDGPGVQVDLGGATVLERTGVEFPGSAWEHKIGGIVVVETTLDAEGNVSNARILSGPAELRKSALQSVLEWHFAPAPAGTTRQIGINFQWEQAQRASELAPKRELFITRDRNGGIYSFAVPNNSPSAATTRLLEEQLNTAQQKLASEIQEIGANLLGKAISQILVTGLTDMQQKQLAERMPVHLGDRLNEERGLKLNQVVSTFDPPLALGFSTDANNQLVISISPDKSR